jgi:hypothetical protein
LKIENLINKLFYIKITLNFYILNIKYITTITTQIIIDHMIELQEKTIILITHTKDLVKINAFIVSVMDIGKNNVGKRKTI